jgi:hypothetical protein
LAAALGAAATLAPVIFAMVLLSKLGRTPPGVLFWVAGGLVVLVCVRAWADYAAALRRLCSLVVLATDDDLRLETTRAAQVISRSRVARITEIDGPLGGLRVHSATDPGNEGAPFIDIPRGGEAFGDVRAHLERWRPIDRRGRRGPAIRVGLGAVIVVGIFFVPFLLDDLVARSRFFALALVVAAWLSMRAVLRGG